MSNNRQMMYISKIKEILDGDFTKSVETLSIGSDILNLSNSLEKIMNIMEVVITDDEEKKIRENIFDKISLIPRLYELKLYLIPMIVEIQTDSDLLMILNLYLHLSALFPDEYPIYFIEENDRRIIFDNISTKALLLNKVSKYSINLTNYSENLENDLLFKNFIRISHIILRELYQDIECQSFLDNIV